MNWPDWLSLPQLQAHYGTKLQCCLTRNGPGYQLWECWISGYQSSSIEGTVMEHRAMGTTA